MIVMVANGDRMVTDSKVEALSFSIQGTIFTGDLRLLPVQGYDMILGLDWLSKWGEMCVNWKDKWIKFQHEGKEVQLNVTDEVAVVRMCEEIDIKKENLNGSEMVIAQVWLCEGQLYNSGTTLANAEIKQVLDQFADIF
jgi:Retroviral aspartyl protease